MIAFRISVVQLDERIDARRAYEMLTTHRHDLEGMLELLLRMAA